MIRLVTLCALSLIVSGITACTQFPELDRTLTPSLEASEYPRLAPVDPVLALATSGRVDPVQTQANLQGRVAALRARAARLRGSVLSGRERQRLSQGMR